MDNDTAQLVSKSVDKLYYLGITFGALFAGKLALDVYKTMNKVSQSVSNSKTHQSRPVTEHASPKQTRKQRSESFNQREANKKVGFNLGPRQDQEPAQLKVHSHNINEESDDEFNFPINQEEKSNSAVKSKLRKNSIIENAIGENTTIIKICFTGGPCAGKTTAISQIGNMLRDKGYEAMCTPEAANLIFSSGGILDMTTYSVYEGLQFQKSLMGLQIALEKQFVDIISIKPQGKYAFLLCDRGLLDGSAYIEPADFDSMLEESGLDRSDCLNTYDIVIHMVTAAKGAEEHYTLDNNLARSEDLQRAIELDVKLQQSWSMHQNFFYNDNNVESFGEKVARAENFILKILGMPVGIDFHRKFTVRNPEGKFFKYLVKAFACTPITLTDVIFKNTSDENSEAQTTYYVRKRVSSFQNFCTGF